MSDKPKMCRETLRRRIENDPDLPCEAGLPDHPPRAAQEPAISPVYRHRAGEPFEVTPDGLMAWADLLEHAPTRHYTLSNARQLVCALLRQMAKTLRAAQEGGEPTCYCGYDMSRCAEGCDQEGGEPMRIGGGFAKCDRCGEEYHSSTVHECPRSEGGEPAPSVEALLEALRGESILYGNYQVIDKHKAAVQWERVSNIRSGLSAAIAQAEASAAARAFAGGAGGGGEGG